MPHLFISYRRDDSAGHAGRLNERLRTRFGAESVFMDINEIEPGISFVEKIVQAIKQCDVQLILIGKRWLNQCSQRSTPWA